MARKTVFREIATAVVILVLVTMACGPLGGGEAGPSVTITAPPSGTSVQIGEEVQIVSTAAADKGVARVEVLVNGQQVRSVTPPEGNPTTFTVSIPWTPVVEGEVTISVIAYDTEDNASEPAAITLQVVAGAAAVTPTPEPDVEGPGGCTLNASFVADVTVPDNTEFAPGESFVKTWRIRNSGTCNWGPGFKLVFVGGDAMGGPASVDVPPTAAGSTVDISVNLVAPNAPGTYRGDWRLQSDTGLLFGTKVFVQIVVPEPTAAPTETPTGTPTEAPTEEATPAPPGNLQANVQPDGSVLFTWEDAEGEAQYRYEFGFTGEGGMPVAVSDNLPADTTSWNSGVLGCNGSGSFTIIALAADGSEIGRLTVNFSTPACPPTEQTWAHAVDVRDFSQVYYLRLTGPGEIRVRAEWSDPGIPLALIINGPGQVGYYARQDGTSPLEVAYTVTAADFAAGDTWRVSIVNFNGTRVEGTVELTYPSGSSASPFVDSFDVQEGIGAAVNLIVLNGPGEISAEATWTGTPASMALMINGPGRVGYYARQDGGSPLSVEYTVTEADFAHGDTWRVKFKAFSTPNAEGNITITYP